MSIDKITIAEAAKILGVNKKTLMRWDALGKFPSEREALSGIRYYDKADVLNHAVWFKLRKKHKENLRELDVIRKEVDKYIVTQPLGPFDKPHFHKLEDMAKAFDNLHKWEREHKKILEEYSTLPLGFHAKVDPDF
ncbi:hypothetical protein A2627_05555 [Candidatus Woesebacteria bacterium RIFCSPHIGHO2_01_FULL_39_28]|uniref:HTH merR-type domain-containing protein n=1 Tax=Candidatus Woesebacteria bacterium RIFCSPHIGHO2_01_FULL_39_28 TaxID=1802496 RepID=A0A1F7YHV6_9BACT|nr:MAG: hypothetical protein A2627_05555 [Candidatus Woesebacteria bacterium RIFCSPHIGHO2_01_FULL_39_28]OGM56645.1 MAG: hypothetical protein A3A50_04750 [Candidatus Woesebacteria bacterium RIFCSPLOWO2_01_FULL_38_20]